MRIFSIIDINYLINAEIKYFQSIGGETTLQGKFCCMKLLIVVLQHEIDKHFVFQYVFY